MLNGFWPTKGDSHSRPQLPAPGVGYFCQYGGALGCWAAVGVREGHASAPGPAQASAPDTQGGHTSAGGKAVAQELSPTASSSHRGWDPEGL